MKQFEKYQVQEIQVSYTGKVPSKEWQIKSSKDAANILQSVWNQDAIALQESFAVLLLNNSNYVKGIYKLSTGGVSATLVDIRLLFAVALKSVTTGLILAHNHPTGRMDPSNLDKELTKKIVEAATYFDIKVLDHIILSPFDDYYSFADNGLV